MRNEDGLLWATCPAYIEPTTYPVAYVLPRGTFLATEMLHDATWHILSHRDHNVAPRVTPTATESHMINITEKGNNERKVHSLNL